MHKLVIEMVLNMEGCNEREREREREQMQGERPLEEENL